MSISIPTPPPKITNAIAIILLIYFGLCLFIPAGAPMWPALATFKIEADSKQTLFTLVTAVVFFFIGKNSDSSKRDDQSFALASQLAVSTPPATPDPSTPSGSKTDPLNVAVTAAAPAAVKRVTPVFPKT